MTSERNRYICFGKDNIDDKERIAVEKYWELNYSKPRTFISKVSIIAEDFGLSTKRFAMLIRDYYFLMERSSSTTCDSCGHIEKIYSRAQYSQLVKKSSFRCKACTEKDIKLKRIELKEKIEAQEYRKEAFAKLNFNGGYKIDELSYLEKLFLYLFISDKNITANTNEYLYIPFDSSVTSSKHVDSKIIRGLVKKNVLFSILNEFTDDENVIPLSTSSKLFDEGMYFVNSEHYRGQYHFLSDLYNDMSRKTIHYNDLEEIVDIVSTIRIENLYTLINFVESERGISIHKKLKLEALLQHVSNKYSLKVCSYLFNKIANDVASYLYKNETEPYSEKYFFAKFLDNHLTTIEGNKWKIEFVRFLPTEIEPSSLETFMCSFYLDDKINWFDFNSNEIVQLWCDSLVVEDL